jgi:hypothetical protein
MKSTYSVAITATIFYATAEWQVRFAFPAAVDCDGFDSFLETVEGLEALPSVDDMQSLLDDYYFDDEPDIKCQRIYKLSQKDYMVIVHERFDSMGFDEMMDCVQDSFCRNCGAEGPPLEPDGRDAHCPDCGQTACESISVALGVI